jgi:hypothetical protein
MTRLHGHGEINIDRRIATGIGRYVSRSNEGLSFTITKCVTCRVVEKFYSEGRARCAVQSALNIGAATNAED